MITTDRARLRDLTEENRRCRDAAREREILELRHRLAVERLDGRDLVRGDPALVDLHLDDGLPTVHSSRLNVEVLHAAIARHGSLLVRDLIPAPAVERLVGVIDNVFAAFDASAASKTADEAWFSRFPGRAPDTDLTRAWLRTKGGVLAGDSPRATFEIAEVFTAHGIDALAAQYLGQDPILSLDKWTIRRGTAENGIEWHQDGSFLGREVRALNVWLALSECGVDAPSLDIVPRRFDEIVPTGTEGANYSWSVSDDMVARTVGSDGWRRPRFGAGDAMLFDDKLLHRTGSSPDMCQSRYAIETWFFAPSGDTSYIDVPLVL